MHTFGVDNARAFFPNFSPSHGSKQSSTPKLAQDKELLFPQLVDLEEEQEENEEDLSGSASANSQDNQEDSKSGELNPQTKQRQYKSSSEKVLEELMIDADEEDFGVDERDSESDSIEADKSVTPSITPSDW